MRRTTLALLFLVGSGCGKGGGDGQAPAGPSAAPARTPIGDAAARAATPGRPASAQVTQEQRRDYRKRLVAGRKLAGEKRWGEAAAEFERALVAIPMDGRALSELGWASFQAGDYPRSRRASTDAVRVAPNRDLRAASLYNLGRVAEAMGDKGAAARHYAASLLLRPHRTVAERLGALRAAAPAPDGQVGAPLPCATPRPDADLCACLGAEDENAQDLAAEDYVRTCDEVATRVPGVKIVRLTLSPVESDWWIAREGPRGWSIIGSLGYFYEGGVAGISATRELAKVELRRLGGGTVLWVETIEERSDSDLGIDEIEGSVERIVTLCVLDTPTGTGTPSCPLGVPLESRFSRERMGTIPDEEIDDEQRQLMTPGLPIHEEATFEVRLHDERMATVALVKGTASEPARSKLGTHPLW